MGPHSVMTTVVVVAETPPPAAGLWWDALEDAFDRVEYLSMADLDDSRLEAKDGIAVIWVAGIGAAMPSLQVPLYAVLRRLFELSQACSLSIVVDNTDIIADNLKVWATVFCADLILDADFLDGSFVSHWWRKRAAWFGTLHVAPEAGLPCRRLDGVYVGDGARIASSSFFSLLHLGSRQVLPLHLVSDVGAIMSCYSPIGCEETARLFTRLTRDKDNAALLAAWQAPPASPPSSWDDHLLRTQPPKPSPGPPSKVSGFFILYATGDTLVLRALHAHHSAIEPFGALRRVSAALQSGVGSAALDPPSVAAPPLFSTLTDCLYNSGAQDELPIAQAPLRQEEAPAASPTPPADRHASLLRSVHRHRRHLHSHLPRSTVSERRAAMMDYHLLRRVLVHRHVPAESALGSTWQHWRSRLQLADWPYPYRRLHGTDYAVDRPEDEDAYVAASSTVDEHASLHSPAAPREKSAVLTTPSKKEARVQGGLEMNKKTLKRRLVAHLLHRGIRKSQPEFRDAFNLFYSSCKKQLDLSSETPLDDDMVDKAVKRNDSVFRRLALGGAS